MDIDISIRHLSVRYGGFRAVNDVSFDVRKGEIVVVIGPNGSGKTSTVECAEGLRRPESGEISVLGMDPQKHRREINRRVGIQLQNTEYQSRIKVGELCSLFQSFYPDPADGVSLLNQFGLLQKKNDYVSSLSGGERQKLSVVLSLLPKPSVLFLDELTTGLDPEARRDIWDLIRKINDSGTTVLMVSHFMEEVEYLADRVILMKAGKILFMGTVAGMKTDFGCSHKVSFRVQNGAPFQPDEMRSQTGIQKLVCKDRDITAFGNGDSLQETVRNYLSARHLTYGNFQFQTVSLEDLYLFYTGYGSGRSERDGIQ